MYVPATRERVQITGRSEMFIVVAVDGDTEHADLVSLTARAFLAEKVPFLSLRPVKKEVPLERQ